MTDGTISGNQAAEKGGGVYANSGTFTMTITPGRPPPPLSLKHAGTLGGGGGVYMEPGAFTPKVGNNNVTGNTTPATNDPGKDIAPQP
jgi:predicted outer membrane repeat protein